MISFEDLVHAIAVWALPLLIAVTLHEAGHAFAARELGDDTAYRRGRMTLNPLSHIDRFGTIVLPALLLLSGAPILIGWAKPVPIDTRRLSRPRRDIALVALAGPGANVVLAIIAAWLLRWAALWPDLVPVLVYENLFNAVWINILLAVFNMLPIPSLDGSRVLVGLLPPTPAMAMARLDRYGLPILLLLLFILPLMGPAVGLDLNIVSRVVSWPTHALYHALLRAAGVE